MSQHDDEFSAYISAIFAARNRQLTSSGRAEYLQALAARTDITYIENDHQPFWLDAKSVEVNPYFYAHKPEGHAAGKFTVHIGALGVTLDHVPTPEEALRMRQILDNVAAVDENWNAMVVKAHHGSKRPMLESCAEVAAYEAARARQLAMPPGLWMSRIARGVFFFSPKTVERVFEEIIADYRHEMLEAEWKGRTADLRWLRVQYWGAFIKSLITELAAGSLGRIIRALTDG
jgi:hypothetical protein